MSLLPWRRLIEAHRGFTCGSAPPSPPSTSSQGGGGGQRDLMAKGSRAGLAVVPAHSTPLPAPAHPSSMTPGRQSVLQFLISEMRRMSRTEKMGR